MNEIPLMPEEEYHRLQQRSTSEMKELWDLLDEVKDPEIPALSIWDLGILRDIERQGEHIIVTITPTYSGCPAMDTITEDVKAALNARGYESVEVKLQLSPAWSSEWMSPEGRRKLRDYGVAPPEDAADSEDGLTPDAHTLCPHCGSRDTRLISEFGSTACKALFQCQACKETFDYFKKI
ncbi:1,2-phenylacetyl-CoA epoxidase subunit PaaD [Billgrantia kenyensis]|jgi:ring-1,2-phenylacetyl-CoA epoxidase subunit PaaD|uniref:Phenylacetate-CoA oxygenase subunit PaaJ n=1 Tax=Billgrantia kenyensis TaxID=321266 RepID=A0A7V9VZ29_9GAMM|nr:1,2-phenylacetyl-CoA epoxidase subunit PaaD [Halomonas kenyensis]MBA2777962.1 phenylacetate-CoA oxygenase subunit PaaJ [Halomonas kenyensis]MCG6661433.1 phenylacetate-CoA oxygenase subunit PaaJ [Halomonas kenyensis]